MSENIRDFKCTYANSAGIREEVTAKLGLSFPDAYLHRDSMKTLAKAIKEGDNANYCILPFCRTLEAEALGGNIKMGDATTGPRAGEPAYQSLDELLELPEIDFGIGRIRETLDALKELKEEGEVTTIEIVGPTTILTSLCDAKLVYKAYRKNSELLQRVMQRIGEQLLRYIEEAKKVGVDIILFSDSAGALDIVGPKMMGQYVDLFLADFVRRAGELMDERSILLLCPKFSLALEDTEKARIEKHFLEPGVDFVDALLAMRGKAKVAGQLCFKHTGVRLGNGIFWELVL